MGHRLVPGSSVARRPTQAFCGEGAGKGMGLYFGATSGDVFGSGDAGRTWFTAATKLPPVHSVRAA